MLTNAEHKKECSSDPWPSSAQGAISQMGAVPQHLSQPLMEQPWTSAALMVAGQEQYPCVYSGPGSTLWPNLYRKSQTGEVIEPQ